MAEQSIEYNYYPITLEIAQGSDNPQTNTGAVALSGSNIIPSANGSVLEGRTLQSPNFSKGNSGWQLNSDGDIEAQNATIRGTITAESGSLDEIRFGAYFKRVQVGENINDAINDVYAAGGGTVFLDSGIHTPAYNIVLKSGVTIQGQSSKLSIIDFQTNN